MISRFLRALWQTPAALLLITAIGAGGAIALTAVSAQRTYDDLEGASQQRQSAYEFLVALRLLRQHTGEARVGLTGYVLTRDTAYKTTYLNGIAGLKTDTSKLRQLVRTQPTLDRILDHMGPAIAGYEAALAATMARSDREPIAAIERDLQSSRDFVLLDGLRVQFVALESEQKRLLAIEAANVESAIRRSRRIITIATLLGALLALGAGGILLAQMRARERIAQTLREREQQMSSVYDTAADALFQLVVEPDGEFRFVSVNRSFLRTTGMTSADIVGHRVEDVLPGPSLPRALTRFRQAVKLKQIVRWEDIASFPAGTITGDVSVAPVLDAAGNCGYLVGAIHDSTDRMHAEAALRESEERFREMAAHLNEAFFIVDIATRLQLYVSPAWATIWGRPIEEGHDPDIWFNAVHPDDKAGIRESLVANAAGEPTTDIFRILRPDGNVRWLRGRAFPVRDALGNVYRLAGVTEDITEERVAEARSLQAQKMEAVGLLAGGVAHDFNNLLTVILGHVDIALSELKPGEPHHTALREVWDAAMRAASLTRQLLAFSRQQAIEPVVFDATEVVSAFVPMVRRLIGETIDVVTTLDPNAGFVRADRGQFEQILMNLVVNSRDAMHEGGRLTIGMSSVAIAPKDIEGADDIEAGDYVVLSVSDTGAGMSDAVRLRVFEPFFTTKELGKGTGLGLATTYGIVKQSGGYVTVHSEVGVGSTFRVYLPRVRN